MIESHDWLKLNINKMWGHHQGPEVLMFSFQPVM